MMNISYWPSQLARLCGRRRLISTRKLLWLVVALYVLFVVLALQAFIFNAIETLGNKLVLQPNHVHRDFKPNVSKIQVNTTSSVSTKQLRVLAPSIKTPNMNWSNKYTTDKLSQSDCRTWCHGKENATKPYFLTAVLLVRIYVSDLAQLSTRELTQWFYFLRYAGFEHVYVYDAFVMKNESQRSALKGLMDERFVTYIDWSHKAHPYSLDGTQHAAYQDCINRYGHESVWQAAIDMDEYPFSPTDQKPFFASKAVKRFSENAPGASELTMLNFLFLGKPLDGDKHPFLIDRIWRRTHGPANALVKPIYKPPDVSRAIVHHNFLARGMSMNFPRELLRMNHYWGARLQNWGEDTPEIIAKTEPDKSIEPIVKALQNCMRECVPSVDYLYQKRWN